MTFARVNVINLNLKQNICSFLTDAGYSLGVRDGFTGDVASLANGFTPTGHEGHETCEHAAMCRSYTHVEYQSQTGTSECAAGQCGGHFDVALFCGSVFNDE